MFHVESYAYRVPAIWAPEKPGPDAKNIYRKLNIEKPEYQNLSVVAKNGWIAGIQHHFTSAIVPDPTNNPLDRLEINVLPESGFTAAGLATALARAQIPIIVRNHEVERGHFFLDPCNLHPGEAETVARELHSLLSAKERPSDAMLVPQKSARNIRKWPD